MKKTFLLIVLLTVGTAVPAARAESLSGRILSIDAQKGIIGISAGGQAQEISVNEFLKNRGSKELDGLDVGLNLTAAVRKNPDGKFELVAIEKLKEPVRTAENSNAKGRWLKSSGEVKAEHSGERNPLRNIDPRNS